MDIEKIASCDPPLQILHIKRNRCLFNRYIETHDMDVMKRKNTRVIVSPDLLWSIIVLFIMSSEFTGNSILNTCKSHQPS